MTTQKIKNLEHLLNLDASKKIVEQKVVPLTAPGENYGSLMLAVELTLKTPKGLETLSIVAKTVPPNELLQKIFRTGITFKNEIAFYRDIYPMLKEFQREMGIAEENLVDFAADFLGGRISLDPNSREVDNDGVLLLENLKKKDYMTLDRFKGMDLDAAKLVLKNLAHLHSIPIAMKMKNPEKFQVIKKILESNKDHVKSRDDDFNMSQRLVDVIAEDPRSKSYFEGARKAMTSKLFAESRELFSTLAHNDLWINNTMFKIEDGKAIAIKLVDFQIFNYASLSRDLVFFIFTSIKNEIVRESYDDLIKFYYDTFISMLNDLKCDTSKFSYEAFLDDIAYEAQSSQFLHCLFMTLAILLPKSEALSIDEIDFSAMSQMELTELHKEKIVFLAEEFGKRNWI